MADSESVEPVDGGTPAPPPPVAAEPPTGPDGGRVRVRFLAGVLGRRAGEVADVEPSDELDAVVERGLAEPA